MCALNRTQVWAELLYYLVNEVGQSAKVEKEVAVNGMSVEYAMVFYTPCTVPQAKGSKLHGDFG